MEFEFAFQMQSTSFKLNEPQTIPFTSCDNINMCLSIALNLYLDFFVCLIDVQPESQATPFVEDTVIEPRQQGKQPPL